jgi:hypothetical protein
MKSKIQVSFNQVQYEVNLKSLQENVIRYRKYLDACEHITEKREFQSVEQIEAFIKNKTSFSNIILSAGLLEVETAYKFIKENFNKINLDVLDVNDNVITTKQEVLDKIKEDATEYLKEEFIAEYKTLLNACNELNKLNNVNSSNFLKRSYDGKFSVNLSVLQNSDRM